MARFSAFNVVFARKNAFKCKEMLVLALVSLFCVVQCFRPFPSAFIALKPIMCLKRDFSAK